MARKLRTYICESQDRLVVVVMVVAAAAHASVIALAFTAVDFSPGGRFSSQFDYIHIRQLAAWIDDWPRMIKQAYRALKPGGYIEIQDLTDFFHCDDGSLPTDSCLNQWIHLADQALRQIDRPWLGVQDLCRELFRREGFVEITERSVKCPIGTWPRDKVMKEIGLFARQMKYDGVEAFILSLFTKVLKWDAEKVMEFAEKAKKELMNSKYHSYERFYCIYSRKPPVQED